MELVKGPVRWVVAMSGAQRFWYRDVVFFTGSMVSM